jgi:hypothetical protein
MSREANTVADHYVHKYDVALVYNGPEEGGQYFTAGTPTGFTLGPLTEHQARVQCRKYNELERERQQREERYEFSSVLAYRSTHYEYDIDTNPVGTPFPQERPHYE